MAYGTKPRRRIHYEHFYIKERTKWNTMRETVRTIHAALYPERYGSPRLWDRVPFPQAERAFDVWWQTTALRPLLEARGIK